MRDVSNVFGTMTARQVLQRCLMASYAYYYRFCSVIEDEEFDAMMASLVKHWDDFEHPHKSLLEIEDLKAGTAFTIKFEDYPQVIKQAAEMWIREKSLEDNLNIGRCGD